MAKKNKKQKKGLSDAVSKKKSSQNKFSSGGPKKTNPFEVHVNREKFEILGRKSNHSRGLPGASRAKAFQKRKETLGQEFLLKDKANKFIDRRIAGHGESGSMARFASEKMLQFTSQRKDLFNLNDDEILTHKGQTLAEIEQFHNDASDNEVNDDDEELNANFTEAAHFGGGDSNMDRQAAIDKIILDSKQKKMQDAKEKEEMHQLTDDLDAKYKQIISVMGKLSKKDDVVKSKPDDYDRAMREMIFEAKGSVTDKLESAEEIAEKENARLHRLEQERLARMRIEDGSEKVPHKSADALDDDFYFGGDDDDGDEEEPNTIAYGLDGQREVSQPDEEEEQEDEDSNLGDDLNENNGEEANEDEDIDDEEDIEEEDDDDDDDNLSDLKDSESEEEVNKIYKSL